MHTHTQLGRPKTKQGTKTKKYFVVVNAQLGKGMFLD
jgi:hypothetical protein